MPRQQPYDSVWTILNKRAPSAAILSPLETSFESPTAVKTITLGGALQCIRLDGLHPSRICPLTERRTFEFGRMPQPSASSSSPGDREYWMRILCASVNQQCIESSRRIPPDALATRNPSGRKVGIALIECARRTSAACALYVNLKTDREISGSRPTSRLASGLSGV